MGILVVLVVLYLTRALIVRFREQHAWNKLSESIHSKYLVQDSLGSDDPYEMIRAANTNGGSDFRAAFVRGFAYSARQNYPGAILQFDDSVDFTDLGNVARVIVHYQGSVPVDSSRMMTATGQSRQYFHRMGMGVLEGMCFTEVSVCAEITQMLDGAEDRYLLNVDGADIGGVLSTSGECSTEVVRDSLTLNASDVVSCFYQPGTVMSFTRLGLEDTRAALKAPGQVGATRRLLRELAK